MRSGQYAQGSESANKIMSSHALVRAFDRTQQQHVQHDGHRDGMKCDADQQRGEGALRGDFVQVSMPVRIAGYDGGRFEKGMQEQANEHPDGQRPVRCMRTVFPMARVERAPVVDAPGEKPATVCRSRPASTQPPTHAAECAVRFGQHVEYDNAQTQRHL